MTTPFQQTDVIIIGAGAAGLMCAATSAQRGRRVVVFDHAQKIGEKIRISGGGRCNFTNLYAGPQNYLSQNPRFCISALQRFTQHDFIDLIREQNIAYHERDHGQLFCDDSAGQIIDLLVGRCKTAGARLQMNTHIINITPSENGYTVETDHGPFACQSLVIASGGKSIPKIGASGFGYHIAKRFGLRVVPMRAGLAPLTFEGALLSQLKELAGIAIDVRIRLKKTEFSEALLFTHRGLSGPAILQISSYWHEGDELRIDLVPGTDAFEVLKTAKADNPKQDVATAVATILPKRLAKLIVALHGNPGRIVETSDKVLRRVAQGINDWRVTPSGSEGYRTAEVTVGGVDTRDLSSKTMEAKTVPGLYFIGEVMDVTGELGGFNFQWAWSSGYTAGQFA
ncbi:MAG: NAD(P)/FAD-dependent oxidoreductase [Magnetovibrio sp.]|nr:NAD(P)/FAD-dependent oxidoreductase [Magnetovibrio sp.]